jgi:hypothetical protein
MHVIGAYGIPCDVIMLLQHADELNDVKRMDIGGKARRKETTKKTKT